MCLFIKGVILYFLPFYVAMIMQILFRQNENPATVLKQHYSILKLFYPKENLRNNHM